jgi:hypothetical protein
MLPGVTLLTGMGATENALKQLQSPKILHIATHGFFLNNVPLVAPPDFSGSLFQEGVSMKSNPLLFTAPVLPLATPRTPCCVRELL